MKYRELEKGLRLRIDPPSLGFVRVYLEKREYVLFLPVWRMVDYIVVSADSATELEHRVQLMLEHYDKQKAEEVILNKLYKDFE